MTLKNQAKFKLIVKPDQNISNLHEVVKIKINESIDYYSSLNVSISARLINREDTNDYWKEEVSKFINRKKYRVNGIKFNNTLDDNYTVFKLSGGIAFPYTLFVSNFDGEIPTTSVIGVKSFNRREFTDKVTYEELAEVTLGKSHLVTKPINFSFSAEKVILLSSAIQRNYYHWMVECLPKLESIIPLLKADRSVKLLLDFNLPSFVYDSLALYGISQDRVKCLKEVTAFSEVVFATRISRSNQTISPLVKSFYQNFNKRFLNKNVATRSTSKRIYISRANAHMRRLVNEEKLTQKLEKFGFKTIYSEELSLIEQAQVFYDANFIIGAHGAGLANLVFCRPKTKVIELIHAEFNQGVTSYAALSELFSLEYYLHVSEAKAASDPQSKQNSDFYADLDMLDSALTTLLP